jgi:hypothetical protein
MASLAAVTTAASAVVCGIACVVPFVLPAVMVTGLSGPVLWLARGQAAVTVLATLIVASAWGAVGVQIWRARRAPARATVYAMIVASAVLSLALVWPQIELVIIRRFGFNGSF